MKSPSDIADDVARALGPMNFDPPLFPIAAHPFSVVFDNTAGTPAAGSLCVCGRCGGGLLHPIHASDAQIYASDAQEAA